MSKTVMIIDDAQSMRQVVSLSLHDAGYTIIEGSDGMDALQKLKGATVDMFICDVNMPNMDGMTFLKTIRNEAEYAAFKFTPFIMLTTEIGEDIKKKGKELGANAWIIKPFKPDQLIDAVKKLMK